MSTYQPDEGGITYEFLNDGGEMGERTRQYDWASSAIGSPNQWPKSLQAIVAIILSSRFPMFLWWGPDLIQFYNDAYRPSLGNEGKHPGALGQAGKECWPEIWDIIFPLIQIVLTTGEATWSEDQLIPIYRNGAIQDVFWTFGYSPVRDDHGMIAGVLVICAETTPKVSYLRELTESKRELEFAIAAADLGTWDLNPATNRFTANGRLKEWFGLQPDEEIDLDKAVAAMHEDDRQRVTEAILKALNPDSGGHYDIDYRVINPNSGVQHIVSAKGKALFDQEGRPIRFNGILQDITEQKQAEAAERLAHQKLKDNEKNIRNIILKAPIPICILRGPDHVIDIANERMIELWGVPASQVLHKPMFAGLPEVRDQGFEALLHAVFHTGKAISIQEYPVQLPRNGQLSQEYISFLFEPEIDASGSISGILAVAFIITDQVLARHQVEGLVNERTRELAEANRNLERSNADLSQFAHIASHDLQEPIRKINIYAQLLESDLGEAINVQTKDYLSKINTAGNRMVQLIRDILAYSELSKSAPTFEIIDLQQVLYEVQSEFELLIEQKGAQFDFNGLPTVSAIHLQMVQLFGNLISNALKYAKADTRPIVTVTSQAEGNHYHIQVTDNGIGFDPKYADQIFSIFQRLHRKTEYSGTGIGLAICKKIVQNHHGDIYATSQSGNGAVFHVLLPAG
jgi:PAS domain S-box-containing protein